MPWCCSTSLGVASGQTAWTRLCSVRARASPGRAVPLGCCTYSSSTGNIHPKVELFWDSTVCFNSASSSYTRIDMLTFSPFLVHTGNCKGLARVRLCRCTPSASVSWAAVIGWAIVCEL
eukprot:359210-Chlamydomonas_euryale.AAC.5